MKNKNKPALSFSKHLQITGHQGPIYALDQDKHFIYSASADKFVARWNKQSGEQDQLAIRCTQTPYSLCVLAAKQQLALGLSDGSIHIIDILQKTEVKNIKAHQAAVFTIATNSFQKHHYSADAAGNLLIWDDAWNLQLNLPLNCGKIRQIKVSTDGAFLWLACADGHFIKLDSTFFNEEQKVFAHQDGCTALCLLPNGEILSAGKDAYIRRWSKNATKLNAFPAHLGTIYQLVLLEGGAYASASRDKSIKIWSQVDDQIIQKLDLQMAGHRHSINALTPYKNGFISAGDDKRIIIWQAEHSKTL